MFDAEPAIAPHFVSSGPNAPIVLKTGAITLQQGARSEVLPPGSLAFEWIPHAGVVGTFNSRHFRLGEIIVKSETEALLSTFEVFEVRAGGRLWAMDDVVVRRSRSTSPSMMFVDIHVPNLPHIQGDAVGNAKQTIFGRQCATFGEWRLVMDPILNANAHAEAAKAVSGNQLTHVIRAARTDGRPFRLKHVQPLMDDLNLVLGFIFGDYLGPLLAAGRNSNGEVVLEIVRTYVGFGWRSRSGVATKRTGIGDMLTCLGKLFANRNKVLSETIWWYLEACWCMMEASVVLAQAALERISHYHLVTNGGLLTDEAFGKLTAADCIRLTMRTLGVPLDLAGKGTDTPLLVTNCRNQQVHPKAKGPVAQVEQARTAALHAVELLLLRLAGYDGLYHPRTARNVATEVSVPWATPHDSEGEAAAG